MAYRLRATQKWQLALSLVLVYYPVLLYLDFPVYSPGRQFTLPILFYQLVVGIVILLFYFLWVYAAEWVLHQLSERFGERFMLEFKWPAQVVSLVLAAGLAMSFVIASREVLRGLDFVLQEVFQVKLLLPTPPTLTSEFGQLYKRANIGFFLLLMLSGFYLIANRRANMRLQEMQLRAERLEKDRVQAQFAALKSQVNPHFLFNSLNMLSSLVHVDAQIAEKFVEQLSQSYRYILEGQHKERVPLKTELAFIESYVFLLKIRFADKFELIHHLTDDDLQRYQIAPLTLQMLVENAVKHNQMSQEMPLRVSISREGDELVVRNNLQRRPHVVDSTGLGLQNIISRYRVLTNQTVRIEEAGETFTVKIPLLV